MNNRGDAENAEELVLNEFTARIIGAAMEKNGIKRIVNNF
jgi:hypothetical protein